MDFIEKLNDPVKLRQLMVNARNKNASDIYARALSRLCEVSGEEMDDPKDPIVRQFYRVLAAYETLLSEKNNRTTRASRTRQKLGRVGVRKCLVDWANSPQPSEGFTLLVQNGLTELTAEAVVVKNAHEFDHATVENAKRRLDSVASD